MSKSFFAFVTKKLKNQNQPPLNEQARIAGSLWRMGLCAPDDLVERRGFAVYDEMQRDAQIQACLSIKKLAVLSRGWQIHPASNGSRDAKIAAFVESSLNKMRGSVLDVLYNTLDAIAKGYAVLEINYRLCDEPQYTGLIGLESIKSKDPASFRFETDQFLNITALKSIPEGGVMHPDKFIVYAYMPSYESPYGRSDLRAAYKHYWSKDLLTKFMNIYLEKYGSPTVKGSYSRGTSRAAQEELLKVLDKVQQETAIVVPDDLKIEMLEAQRGGEAGYLSALEWHDKQIAKAILGQTLMTDEGTRVGSFALAKVHLDVLRMCLMKLKRDLEESVMQEQVIRRLVDYNFPSVSAYPSFCLGALDERDFASIADSICKLVNGKVVAPNEYWIREYLGIPTGVSDRQDAEAANVH